MSLPNPGFSVARQDTALVVIDPQNDFLSPSGATWDVVGKSVTENNTVDNLAALLRESKRAGLLVFVSPHYYYPHDHRWQFEGALERLMHEIQMFERSGPLDLAFSTSTTIRRVSGFGLTETNSGSSTRRG